jgi:flagellar M-ring protein FliF
MAAQPQQLLTRLTTRFQELPATRKMGLAAALAAAVALIVVLFLWSSAPEYRVLFSNLSDKDAGAVTAALQQMNVQHRTEAGGTILVPANQVYDLRFRLAGQGLPQGGAVGFELMDSTRLGMTQFQEQVAYQRGLEGELSRTIQSLAPVESARVHLAIPKPSVFIRDRQRPSASVLVRLRAGRALDAGQVQSIVHLVSSSVPELTANSVTVVDQAGNLLTASGDAMGTRGLNSNQLDYTRQIEAYYAQRIEAIVKPIVGDGNVKAEVRADLDFSETEATSESYRPNPSPETQAIRSQQTVEDQQTGGGGPAQGVPGALTNQPPGPAAAPFETAPGANAGTTAGGQVQASSSRRRENTVNYELDKTIRHVREPVGRIKRLSVAVVVNYKNISGEQGEAPRPAPLPAEELAQINNLVREAMGYNQERGDTVNVVNAAFTEAAPGVEPSLWKDPDNIAMAKSLLKNLLVFGLAFYLVFGVLRPLLRDLVKEPQPVVAAPGELALGGVGGVDGREGAETGAPVDSYGDALAKAREFAKSNPKVTADIVKEWMAKE